MTRDAAVEAFTKMDRSGDRSISIAELQRWLDPHAKLLTTCAAFRANPTSRAASAPALKARWGAEEVVDTALCYSPTKLETRLAMVRAFEPRSDEASRRRPPLRPLLTNASAKGGLLLAPNSVRERVWSLRKSETTYKLGPSSTTCPPGFKVAWKF